MRRLVGVDEGYQVPGQGAQAHRAMVGAGNAAAVQGFAAGAGQGRRPAATQAPEVHLRLAGRHGSLSRAITSRVAGGLAPAPILRSPALLALAMHLTLQPTKRWASLGQRPRSD